MRCLHFLDLPTEAGAILLPKDSRPDQTCGDNALIRFEIRPPNYEFAGTF